MERLILQPSSTLAASTGLITAISTGKLSKPKPERHLCFTANRTAILVCKVVAAKTHMTCFGEMRKCFVAAATKADENSYFKQKIGLKTIRDLYKWLQDQFDKAGKDN